MVGAFIHIVATVPFHRFSVSKPSAKSTHIVRTITVGVCVPRAGVCVEFGTGKFVMENENVCFLSLSAQSGQKFANVFHLHYEL